MILYALVCGEGHQFESWFRDSAAFDKHEADRLLSCPVCASTHIAKSIMAPTVASRQVRKGASAADLAASCDSESRDARDAIRRFRAHVFAEGHDVGPRFAAEARRIHDGDAPDRQIYGQASIAETRDLLEDGILVLPLPCDPDAMN